MCRFCNWHLCCCLGQDSLGKEILISTVPGSTKLKKKKKTELYHSFMPWPENLVPLNPTTEINPVFRVWWLFHTKQSQTWCYSIQYVLWKRETILHYTPVCSLNEAYIDFPLIRGVLFGKKHVQKCTDNQIIRNRTVCFSLTTSNVLLIRELLSRRSP